MSEVQIDSPIWKAIMADPELAGARRKLSFHEIRLIIKHATGQKHRFWGAGEPDCPSDIKAGNGELWKLRCKACGQDNPRDDRCFPASVDTHPQGGDSAQTEAPFMSGAVPSQTADAQHPLARMVELDEEIEADHPGWMTGDAPTGDDNV